MSKILRLSELKVTKDVNRLAGATVCFGHFNTIHPGHVRHFRTACTHGKPLIVAVEGDAQLLSFRGDNIFQEKERAQALATLDLVDYVVILDTGPLEAFLDQVNIANLVLGREFEDERAEKVVRAVEVIRSKGGTVIYDAGETHYAGAELLYGTPGDLERGRWQAFEQVLQTQNVSLSKVFSDINENKKPHILVVGDTIVDRYVACDPVGMSNEAPVIVVKEIDTRDYVGGAGIVAAHISALGAHSTFLSVIGADSPGEFTKESFKKLGVKAILLEDPSRPTTFKIRYLVENQKLFRVSRLKEHSLSREKEEQLIAEIEKHGQSADGVLVSDFVYGVITPRILEAVRGVAARRDIPLFGDLQCSSQVGNILKFTDFSLICPTEREARIALGNRNDGVEYIANLLINETRSANTVLKLGGEGFIAYLGHEEKGTLLRRQHFPALTANPVDVTGAGDALLATMATALTSGLSVMQASALACLVSAIAVQTVGNQPIGREQVRQFYLQNSESGMIDAV